MQTQRDIELEAVAYGQDRMTKNIARNEEHGGADNNPYAQAVYRQFVLPLASVIHEDLRAKRAGRRQAHVQLLKDMHPDAVAFIAVRSLLISLLGNAEDNGDSRRAIANVGTAVYREHLLTHFADIKPDLFYTLTQDFERKMSKDERYRMTVYQRSARDNGVELPVWSSGDRDQVGAYLVDVLMQLGMVNVEQYHDNSPRGKRTYNHVSLTAQTEAVIEQLTELTVLNTPYFLPCVERPLPWTGLTGGGFHTQEMQRMMPFCIKHHPSTRDDLYATEDKWAADREAVNALQDVRWRVNNDMLGAIRRVHQHFDMEEIISQAEQPRPPKPEWLLTDMDVSQLDTWQTAELVQWKRAMAEWYTAAKERGTKWGRFYNAMRIADKFKDYEALHFVHFMDSRGRKYCLTTGISPQGSDMQKALLEFADGKPLHTQLAKDWFKITGANRYGFDKAPLPERAKWVDERHDQIIAFATDCIANDGWTQADKPLQFLAWCFEYLNWTIYGDAFVSRLSVGMDGSCNGLQNFSAMLRDAKGGIATNLVPPETVDSCANDIYGMVAERATELLAAAEEDEAGYRTTWLKHGLNRTLVKRSVMTLPYGSTQYSCSEFIVGDYLKAGKAKEFPKEQYHKAAQYLSKFVWKAIGDVVVKAREAMTWLQDAARQIVRYSPEEEVMIRWTTPTGFPVVQAYWEASVHQIHTKLCGQARLKVWKDTDKADLNRHKNGIAPNFVHSLDASHLTRVVRACKALGIDALHMVHDDFGCHAADAGALYKVIREEFITMYTENDPLEQFNQHYPGLTSPRPELGDLDIALVRRSPFFFS